MTLIGCLIKGHSGASHVRAYTSFCPRVIPGGVCPVKQPAVASTHVPFGGHGCLKRDRRANLLILPNIQATTSFDTLFGGVSRELHQSDPYFSRVIAEERSLA